MVTVTVCRAARHLKKSVITGFWIASCFQLFSERGIFTLNEHVITVYTFQATDIPLTPAVCPVKTLLVHPWEVLKGKFTKKDNSKPKWSTDFQVSLHKLLIMIMF